MRKATPKSPAKKKSSASRGRKASRSKKTKSRGRAPTARKRASKVGKPRKTSQPSLKEFASQRGLNLNADQEKLFDELTAFLADPRERCFLMKGSAGTGKTFLLKPLARFIRQKLKLPVNLAAPTGRAALVLQRTTGLRATTIHRLIYGLEGLAERSTPTKAAQRSPVFYYPIKKLASDSTKAVFIIDEASMVSDTHNKSEFFRWGSGRLLKDLVEFTRLRDPLFQTKIIFVGDACQLPPPGDETSYALSSEYLKEGDFTTDDEFRSGPDQPREPYGLICRQYELTQVERQKGGDILETATRLREVINSGQPSRFQIVTAKGHIRQEPVERICRSTCDSFRADPSDGIIVTYSNKEAFELNMSVRQLLWEKDRQLCEGDRLLVYQNSSTLINGELIVVEKVFPLDGHVIQVRNAPNGSVQLLRFRKIRYRREDGVRIRKPKIEETMILEDFLYWPDRELTPDIFSAIYEDFRNRFAAAYPDMKLGHNFMPRAFVRAMSADPYVTCAKVKFGYAITCHKAQGGQWDQASVVTSRPAEDRSMQSLRWAYTAITRAKKTLSMWGLHEYSPITPLLPKFKPRVLVDEQPGMSLSRAYLDTLFQEELRDIGAKVVKCSVVNNASQSNKAYKYDISDSAERCVLVFSENKDGQVRKLHFERKSKNLGDLLSGILERYGAKL
jgi:hypothetical protein